MELDRVMDGNIEPIIEALIAEDTRIKMEMQNEKTRFISLTDWRLLEQKYQNMDYPIRRIENGYPIQYLIGNVDFYGYKIMVNKNVLIPRFETETLVEKTLKYIDEYKFNKASVLEIGTGSGCISIALKKRRKT